MCGRFTLKTPAPRLAEFFVVPSFPTLSPRYNIAPTQLVVCVRAVDGGTGREAANLKWGLIPSWAKDASIGSRMINARSETAAEKPSFRSAFQRRRCIIPADGFYEWQKLADRRRQPWFIHLPEEAPFGFAGLWESWKSKDSGEVVASCTILTTQASEDLQELHERMPVILPPEAHAAWLSSEASPGQLQSLMVPLPKGTLLRHPVATSVNKVAHDQPDCVTPVELPDSDDGADTSGRQLSLFD